MYIILGTLAVVSVGITAGLLARRKKIHWSTNFRNCARMYTKDSYGQYWKNKEGQYHREDGPAIIFVWGTKDWYINGKHHREDGPAVEFADGNKSWYLNGILYTEENWKKELEKPKCETDIDGNKFWYKECKLHREDGPAFEKTDGCKSWWINGNLHREDGPAVEFADGNKSWYLNGTHYTKTTWIKTLGKPICITDNGIKQWYNKEGQLHREDGPAVESQGNKWWYLNGKRHREVEWKKELDKPICTTDKDGNKYWYNKEGKYHREDGPAIEWADGSNAWYINNKLHREDGPAIEYTNYKVWYLNNKHYTEEEWKKELNKPKCEIDKDGIKEWRNKEGKSHRTDGPAFEYEDGGKSWWINGARHREDGPAIEWVDGTKEWYLNGQKYTEEEWKKELEKPKCEVENGAKYWKNKEGQLHREDGPADEHSAYKSWWLNGERHREDGPAIEWVNGDKAWYLNDKYYTEEEWKKELNKPKCTTDEFGTKYWYNKEGLYHREDGPAIEYSDGSNAWYINNKLHREDGPAVEHDNGYKVWYLNNKYLTEEQWKKELDKPKCEIDSYGNKLWKNKKGQYHREDGPAIESTDGYKQWVINGSLHREDGPAIEGRYGNKSWYLNGIQYTEEDWKQELEKPKCKIDKDGTKNWTNKEHRFHREDGPAIEYASGGKEWRINGKLHREDGPAIESCYGNKVWYLNGIKYTEEQWKQELNKPKCEIDEYGHKRWKNKEGQLHREDGPACEWTTGSKFWYLNGLCHREDGPAAVYANGEKYWYLNGINYSEEETWKKELNKPECTTDEKGNKKWYNKEGQLHREDGPAIEFADGTKFWFINNKYHREDGPAVERAYGTKEWWLNGVNYTEEQWQKEWWLNGVNYTEEQWQKELDKPKCTTDEYGNKFWKNKEGGLHREDGPAIEWASGNKEWYLNGKCHREDGPA